MPHSPNKYKALFRNVLRWIDENPDVVQPKTGRRMKHQIHHSRIKQPEQGISPASGGRQIGESGGS